MKLNIVQKITIGFLSVVIITSIVGAIAYFSLSVVNQRLMNNLEEEKMLVQKYSVDANVQNEITTRSESSITFANKAKSILFSFTMLSLIISIIISFYLANKFTDPILILTKKALEIGQGEYGKKIQVSSEDEIGELANTFNNMSKLIKQREDELESVNQKLHKQNKELEELSNAKSEFVSMVSHELRTPLTAIKAHLSLLRSGRMGGLTETQIHSLDITEKKTDFLNSLIGDLLDLSRIESKKYGIKAKNIDFCQLADITFHTIQPLLEKKHMQFTNNLPNDLPVLLVDPDKIVQVLTNLIGNSIKYTPEGGSITLSARKISPEFVEISVTDNGIGIEKDDLLKIFDQFYRVNTGVEYQGTGLGLSIVKKIIEMHAGTIWVESELRKGSTFYFTLPISKDLSTPLILQIPQKIKKEPAISKKTGTQKNTIMVVDDDKELREVTKSILQVENNWQVITAKDGKEAVEIAFSQPIDLILLDLRMPKLDGFGVIRALKNDPRTQNIPIIILSASCQEADIKKGFDMGIEDYISKPYQPDLLVTKVKDLLS